MFKVTTVNSGSAVPINYCRSRLDLNGKFSVEKKKNPDLRWIEITRATRGFLIPDQQSGGDARLPGSNRLFPNGSAKENPERWFSTMEQIKGTETTANLDLQPFLLLDRKRRIAKTNLESRSWMAIGATHCSGRRKKFQTNLDRD
ncbi:hypothetical protein KSP39_PZI015663 [Platanthera zijinensis]|uniref:Uncharacterized protein n=1 Tax=Platanthera zijinensis TaxID=2320716 RepID=A0AAP0B9G2_9ASPA